MSMAACSDSKSTQAIANVEELINVIEMEEPDKTAIDAARAAYDGLEAQWKDKVSNYQALIDAEKRYTEMLQAKEEQKEKSLKEVHTTLYSNIVGSMTMRDVVVTVWKNAVDNNKYADFNEALRNLYAGKEYKAFAGIPSLIVPKQTAENFVVALNQLETDQDSLAKSMKELADLDIDATLYDALINLYSEYTVLYNQVISPSGSYISYSSDTEESISNIKKAEAELDVVWPY